MLLGFGDDRVDVVFIVEREYTAERIGAQVFDEGLRDSIPVSEEQLFEAEGVFEDPTIGHRSRRVDGRISAEASRNFLDAAPLTDGIVVIPSEAEGIDLGVAGGAIGVLGVGGQFVA